MIYRIATLTILLFAMFETFAGETMIYDFSKSKKYKVVPAYIKTKARKRGFSYAKNDKPARLWYESAPGRDIYSWAVDDLDIKGFDKLILEYKCNIDTFLTIDMWYDGKMVNPRLVSYVKGTGKWEKLLLPVRGRKLKMAFSISETGPQGKDTSGALREILFKGIFGINLKSEKPENIKTSHNIVIPKPKEEVYGKRSICLFDITLKVGINIENINPDTASAALETFIEGMAEHAGIKLDKKSLLNSNGKDVLIVFDIAGRNKIATLLKVKIPSQPEGYEIKCGKYQGKDAIIVSGRDTAGLFWGIQTLLQLSGKENEQVYIPSCRIRDWPGFSYRSMGGGSIDLIKQNLKAKINVNFCPAWDNRIKGKWDNPPEAYRKQIVENIKYCRPRGVQINQWVEPYDRRSKNNIVCSDPVQVEAYYKTFKIGLEQGNRVITIGFDDQVRVKDALQPQDLKKFGSDIKAHASLVADIAKRVNKDYPGTIICTVPKTYQSVTGVDVKGYYDRTGVPESVVVMWTGESTVTLSYPEYKVKAFEQGIEGRRFVIFDNTFCQTLGEGRRLTLFETFAQGYKSLTESRQCLGFHAMAGFSRTELRKIKAYQIADFMWNPESFNPELSRSRAMAKVAGVNAVAPLLEFRYYLMKIAELFPIEKPVKKLEKEFVARTVVTNEELAGYLKILDKASAAIIAVEKNSTNKQLVNELKSLLKNAREMLKFLNRGRKELKVVDGMTAVDFDLLQDARGGKYFKSYSHMCAAKPGLAVYGGKVPGKNRLSFAFAMKKLPANEAQLTIEGQDDDKSGITAIQISLNGNTVFKGKNPFIEKGWSVKTFPVDKAFFKVGENLLFVENLEDSDSFASKWFMLSRAGLSF